MDHADAGWKIRDVPGGRELEVRYRVPLADLLPGYIQRNLPYAVLMLGVNLSLVGLLAWFVLGESWSDFLLVSPVVVSISVVASVLLWPLRFGDWGPPSVDHLLRYRRANRTEHATVRQGHLDLAAGMFDLDSLCTSRLAHFNSLGKLVNVVFDGRAIHDVQLVGWPGLPPEMATELCEALVSEARDTAASMQAADELSH